MRLHIRLLDHKSRGQSLVELALMMPVLMFILAGMLDVGRAYYAYETITNAARVGAGYGSSHPGLIGTDCTTTGTIKFVTCQEAAGSGFQIGASNITVTESPDANSGSTVTVTVSVPFQLITTEIVNLGQIQLQSSATFVIL